MSRLLIVLSLTGSLVLPAVSGSPPQTAAPSSSRAVQDLLRDARALYDAQRVDGARERFELALEGALQTGDLAAEAEARRGLGIVLLQRADYAAARVSLDRALALFEQVGDTLGLSRVRQHLGRLATSVGDEARAIELYRQALAGYESVGELRAQANLLVAMDSLQDRPDDPTLLDRADALAATLGDLSLLGIVAHHRSDMLFSRGDFAGAIAKLETAIALFERANDRSALARALTSLGRINRAHGHPERSIDLYKRALAIQQELGDREGVIQSINATAVAYGVLGKHHESIAHYEQALGLARKTGSERYVQFMLGNLGSAYVSAGQPARGAALLEELLRNSLEPPSFSAARHAQLALAYLRMGRWADVIPVADKSIAFYREIGNPDGAHSPLINRAHAKWKLGLTAEALADTREALALLEHARTQLIPSDFMKQGYGETVQRIFELAVSLFHELGQDDLAFETAARAEGRAFLDLLASRGLDADRAGRVDAPSARSARLPQALQDRASPESAPAPSLDDIRATAIRLRSTVLAYFVTADATYAWVVPPDGPIRATRLNVSAARLKDLVRQTRPGATPTRREPTTAVAAAPLPAPQSFRTRGGDVFIFGTERSTAWRTLHRLLIRPIQRHLDGAPGSRLTILPHGPLSLLSFAALEDEQGRYLLERFTIHYAPAAGALRFTEQTQRRLADTTARYLLVADPSAMPPDGRKGLRALPASRREVTSIASLLPRDAVSVLTGADARESAVRSQVAAATVIHFATHGIVRNDAPFESFLALGRTDDGAAADGRLTAAEIYDLDLRADVVVLSACRSALGTVSGDGVLGLTRAFFYAGAASIVATMWDVADDPTMRLVPDFYRRRVAGLDKAEALRAAQLRLLRDLRAGRVTVGTGAEAVALPENPFFWAGFILTGEP